MGERVSGILSVQPEELVYQGVKFNQVYTQKAVFTNTLSANVEASIRPGSPERYTVSPTDIRLKPGESTTVEISLKILKYAHVKKAASQGQRDIFHIKSKYFDQKYYSTFFLDSELLNPQTGGGAQPPKTFPKSSKDPGQGGKARCPPKDQAKSSTVSMLEASLEQQTEALRDKDEIIRSLQHQMELYEQEKDRADAIRHDDGAEAPDGDLESTLLQVTDELEAAKEEIRNLTAVQLELQTRCPDVGRAVEAAVRREHIAQEMRNQKALDLLQSKDEVISKMEASNTVVRSQNRELQAKLETLIARAKDREVVMTEALASKEKIQLELRRHQAESAAKQGSLKADMAALRGEVEASRCSKSDLEAAIDRAERAENRCRSLESEVELQVEALNAATEEVTRLSSKFQIAQHRIKELEQASSKRIEEYHGQLRVLLETRDSEVARLQGQITEMQAAAEKQSAFPNTSRLAVSLDAGIGGSMSSRSSDYGVLQDRVNALEKANEHLELALARAADRKSKTSASDLAEVKKLHEVLISRDKQISKLQAELAMAYASERESPSPSPETDRLRESLRRKSEQLHSCQERIAQLEKVQRLAQETTLKSEGELDAVRNAMVAAEEARGRAEGEADGLQEAVGQLNVRISELGLAEQCAKAEAESTLSEMERLREQHRVDMEACERRQNQLREALKSMQGRQSSVEPSSADGSTKGTSAGSYQATSTVCQTEPLSADKERLLRQAVEDAELAMAVLQTKLLESESHRRESEKMLEDVKQEASDEKAELQAQITRGKEDGAVRIQSLEETVKKMGSRSDLHMEVGRLSGDNSLLRRSEARLKSELAFAEDRINSLKDIVDDFRARVSRYEAQEAERAIHALSGQSWQPSSPSSMDVLSELEVMDRDRRQNQQVISRLVERAERAEVEAGHLKTELETVKGLAAARAVAGGAGTAAVMSAAQSLEDQTTRLQREMLTREAEVKTLREESEACQVKIGSLRLELVQAAREVSAAQTRAKEAERALQSKEEAASRIQMTASAAFSREVSTASRRATECERSAEAALLAKEEAEQASRDAALNVSKAKADVEALQQLLRRERARAADDKETANALSASCKRECEAAVFEREELKVRVAVLLETIETLQAGELGEREQRIVCLTAQLTTALSKQAIMESRLNKLQGESESYLKQCSSLESDLESIKRQAMHWESTAGSKQAAVEIAEKELTALRSEMKAQSQELVGLSRQIDDANMQVEKYEAETAALKSAAESTAARYFENLNRERSEASSKIQTAKSEGLSQLVRATNSDAEVIPESLDSKLEEIMALVQRHAFNQERKGEQNSENPDWCLAVMHRMKAVALESERLRVKGECDARMARADVELLSTKVRALESALEQRSSEWEVAESIRKNLEREQTRKRQLNHSHLVERIKLQDHRVVALSAELGEVTQKLIDAHVEKQTAIDGVHMEKERSEALNRRLITAEAEVKELQEMVTANMVEASGHPAAEEVGNVEEGCAMRDLALKNYFEKEVVKVLLKTDSREKLVSLTREICGLKMSESQLLASLAAAERRFDASQMAMAKFKAALHLAEQQLQKTKVPPLDVGKDSSVELARVNAQLAAKSHEIFKLREEIQLRSQSLETKTVDVQNLESERSSWEVSLKQAKESGAAALQRARDEASRIRTAEKEALTQELESLRIKHLDALKRAKTEIDASESRIQRETDMLRNECEEKIDAAVTSATADRPLPQDLEEAEIRAAVATDQCTRLEHEILQLQAENATLQEEVSRRSLEIAELEEAKEVTSTAVQSLESTLAKIEKSCAKRRNVSPPPSMSKKGAGARGKDSHMKRGATVQGDGDLSLAALSRQLVHSKLAEADALRKLKVSGRAELELRQRLSERDHRISELKDALASKSRAYDQTKRQLEALQNRPKKAGKYANKEPPSNVASSEIQKGTFSRAFAPNAQGSEEAAKLRIDLSKRNADVLYLEGALAEAQATRLDPDSVDAEISRLKRKVSQLDLVKVELKCLKKDVKTAIQMAESAAETESEKLSSCSTSISSKAESRDPTIQAAVAKLISKLKEVKKEVLIEQEVVRGGAVSESSDDANSAEIEKSQRLVIRDLTAKCTRYLEEIEGLREELSRERMCARDLRARCKNAVSQRHSDTQSEAPGHSSSTGSSDDGVESDHISNACGKMQHSITAMESAHGAITAAMMDCKEDLLSRSGKLCTLWHTVSKSCATLSAELAFVRSELCVWNSRAALEPCISDSQTESVVEPPLAESATQTSSGQNGCNAASQCHVGVTTSCSQTDAPPESSESDDSEREKEMLRNRGDKWKARCKEVRRELTNLRTIAAAKQASLKERLDSTRTGLGEQLEDRKERILQLETLLAGSEAARKELASKNEAIPEAKYLAARAANAEAQVAELECQLESIKVREAATTRTLEEEVKTLKKSLASENNERAKIVMSLRETIGDLKVAGSVEGKLKAEIIRMHEEVTRAVAAKSQAEEEIKEMHCGMEAMQNEVENKALRTGEIQHVAAMRVVRLQQDYAKLETLVSRAEGRLARLEDNARIELNELRSEVPEQDLGAVESQIDVAATFTHDLKQRLQALEDQVMSEDQAANVRQGWKRVMIARRYKGVISELKDEARRIALEHASHIQSLEEQLEVARERIAIAESETKTVVRRIEDLQKFSENERQKLAGRHVASLREFEVRSEAEKRALWDEAKKQAEQASDEGRRRGLAEAEERIAQAAADARREVATANVAREQSQLELEETCAEFRDYKKNKANEIKLLQNRIRKCYGANACDLGPKLRGKIGGGKKRLNAPKKKLYKSVVIPSTFDSLENGQDGSSNEGLDPLEEIHQAQQADTVEEALREAEFERMEKDLVIQELEGLKDVEQGLRVKLKACQKEIKTLKESLSANAAVALDKATLKEECEALRGELHQCQENLKAVKADNSRRQRAMQAMQEKLGSEDMSGLKSELDAERSAKREVEARLQQVKSSVIRKEAIIKDMKKKVEAAEICETRNPEMQEHQQLMGAKLKQLQTTLTRKEAIIKDLRERLEDLSSQVVCYESDDTREKQGHVIQRLKADLQRKEIELETCRKQLQKVQDNAEESLRSSKSVKQKKESDMARASAEAAEWNAAATDLLNALHGSAHLIVRCCSAMVWTAKSARKERSRALRASGVNTNAIASMVDLSASEIEDLLDLRKRPALTDDLAPLSEGVENMVSVLRDAISRGAQQGRARGTALLGIWSPDAADSLVGSLEREVLRAEEELKECIKPINLEHETSHVDLGETSNCGETPAHRHWASAKRAVAHLEAELGRASRGLQN
ncbi:hypothetical protein BSKO_09949 [Bryopsis sp. KO-2023]|nr:hypothetical protein BSKO_09949 [Bryopsis sp. KO-2023]